MNSRRRRGPEPRRFRWWTVIPVVAVAVGLAIFPWAVRRLVPLDADRVLAEARLRLEHGDIQAAERLIGDVLRAESSNVLALIYRGQLAHQRGDWQQALRDFRQAAELPDELAAVARFHEATILLERARAREAEQQLLKAIAMNPRQLEAHERHLQLCVLHMRRDDILQRLAAIEQLRPLTLDELALRVVAGDPIIDYREAAGMLSAFLQADAHDVHSRLALARYEFQEKQPVKAIALLRAAPPPAAADPRVPALLAEMLAEQSQIDAARTLLEQSPLNEESPVAAWKAASKVAEQAGDAQRVVECLEQVVRRNPDDHTSVYQLGLALQRLGMAERAKPHLERSVLLDRLQRQALAAARIDRQRGDILVPLLVEVGTLLQQLDRTGQAAAWFKLALDVDPQHAEALAGWNATRHAADAPKTSLANEAASSTESSSPVLADSPAPRGARASTKARRGDSPSGSRIALRDIHEALGINFQYFNGETGFKYLIESMGGGVAVLDYDADGWPDLYFAQGCRIPVDLDNKDFLDRLYRNRGDGTFEDVTEQAGLSENGYSQGCAAGDIDNDGFVDLVIANYGRNTVYRNQGDGTFIDITESCGALAPQMSSSVALADLDRDGDLDLYVSNYVDGLKVCRDPTGRISTCDPSNFDGEQDRLYLNAGDGTFVDVTEASGIVAPNGKGLGVLVADLDDDGWPDIYVANDGTPNFFFRSQPDQLEASSSEWPIPKFKEEGLISGLALSAEGRAEAGMGIACGDVNGDGLLDLLTTNYYLETCTLYINLGGGGFSDETRSAGLYHPTEQTLGFGTQTIDLDLDGHLDLFIANGHIDNYVYRGEPWKMPPQLFQNLSDGRFEEISQSSGEYFAGKYLGRGAARWDWNRDGLPDLVVVHQDRPVAVLSNESPEPGRRVVVQLVGVTSNRDAIGARLAITAAGRTQIIEVCGGDGFYASNERRQFIGLGTADRVDRLEVRWPSGLVNEWEDLPVDVLMTITEGGAPRYQTLQ